MTAAGAPAKSPSVPTLLARGVTRACPACGTRGQFEKWFRIGENCRRCNLKFERIEGHWMGAIGMNTVVSFGLVLVVLVVGLIATAPDYPVWVLGLALITGLLFPAFFDPFARTLWTGIDIAMRPLEPHEVDWSVVDPSHSARTQQNPVPTDPQSKRAERQ